MKRDFEAHNKAQEKDRELQLWLFERYRERLFEKAAYWQARGDHQKAAYLTHQAKTARFQFSRPVDIQYGNCGKFNKAITFIPNTCQPETQHCFVHRKDFINFDNLRLDAINLLKQLNQ